MNRQWCFLLAGLGSLLVSASPGRLARAEGQDPVFRSGVAVVPVAVRVVNKRGEPVRGLVASDFSVTEDGRPQKLVSFSVEEYTAEATSPSGSTNSSPPSGHRLFVLFLGRGRLQGPSRGFDALADFVRDGTLSSDRLAVVAYDRISEITTDKAAILRFIEAYRENHQRIEALFDHWFRDLTDFHGGGERPPRLDLMIDGFFQLPGLPPVHRLAVQQSEDQVPRYSSLLAAGQEDGFIYNAAARQDLDRLRSVIGHLRTRDGEKHLIVVTPGGLEGLSRTYADRLAALAADARITVSMIHTGGLPASWVELAEQQDVFTTSWEHRWSVASSKAIAEQTGGVAGIYEYANAPLARIQRATGHQYLLGYAPDRREPTGMYRRIRVRVNREGVEVLHRQGYFDNAAAPVSVRDERANSRIAAAQVYRREVDDIPMRVSASRGEKGTVRTEIRVPASALSFTVEAGRHVASLDLAVFVGDGGRQIGETRNRVDLRLTPESFAVAEREGLQFTVHTSVAKGRPGRVKAVIYDFGGDRLGSALVDVR